jgi:hypothetical protein
LYLELGSSAVKLCARFFLLVLLFPIARGQRTCLVAALRCESKPCVWMHEPVESNRSIDR